MENNEWMQGSQDDWRIVKIGSLFSQRNEKVSDRDYPPLSVSKGGIVPQMEGVAKTDANDNRKLVKKGDFVINSRSDRKQSCGVSPLDGSVSLINIVLSYNHSELYPPYVNYLLKNYGFAEEFYRWGHGIVADLWTTRWSEMKNILIPLPSLDEQKRIADFLDDRIGKIDALIENENKQIESLKTCEQSVIDCVVTRGLKENALKNSGIPWIGEIPASWKTIKIKYTSWLKGRIGWDGLKSSEFVDKGPYLITGTDFKGGYIDWDTCVHISEERYEQDPLLHIKEGDLLITKDGTIGKLAIVKNCPPKVSLNSGVMIIRSNSSINKYSDKFLYYILKSSQFSTWYELSQEGNSTIRHLYQGQFYNFEFAYPSIEEQLEISDYLDEKCHFFESYIDLKMLKISKLQHYKRSIIYEYVTGKRRLPS